MHKKFIVVAVVAVLMALAAGTPAFAAVTPQNPVIQYPGYAEVYVPRMPGLPAFSAQGVVVPSNVEKPHYELLMKSCTQSPPYGFSPRGRSVVLVGPINFKRFAGCSVVVEGIYYSQYSTWQKPALVVSKIMTVGHGTSSIKHLTWPSAKICACNNQGCVCK